MQFFLKNSLPSYNLWLLIALFFKTSQIFPVSQNTLRYSVADTSIEGSEYKVSDEQLWLHTIFLKNPTRQRDLHFCMNAKKLMLLNSFGYFMMHFLVLQNNDLVV